MRMNTVPTVLVEEKGRSFYKITFQPNRTLNCLFHLGKWGLHANIICACTFVLSWGTAFPFEWMMLGPGYKVGGRQKRNVSMAFTRSSSSIQSSLQRPQKTTEGHNQERQIVKDRLGKNRIRRREARQSWTMITATIVFCCCLRSKTRVWIILEQEKSSGSWMREMHDLVSVQLDSSSLQP